MTNNVDPNVGNRNWTQFVTVENGKPKEITSSPLFYRTDTGQRPTDEWLAAEGFRGYIYVYPPTYDPYEQKIVQTSIDKLKIEANNVVIQTWQVLPLSNDEKALKIEELKDKINLEREERIRRGANVSVQGAGTIPLRGELEDMRNITNLGQLANMYISSNTSANIPFRDNDNITRTLTPTQMSELWQKTVAYISSLYQASWNIKELSPIPKDYSDNKYWPDRNI